jgi:multidrug efflux pump subunit AcrB
MTILVAVIGIVLCAILAFLRMLVDIFPNLNLPVIYVAQPFGGVDPA